MVTVNNLLVPENDGKYDLPDWFLPEIIVIPQSWVIPGHSQKYIDLIYFNLSLYSYIIDDNLVSR